MGNAYLDRIQAEKQKAYRVAEHLMEQFMTDTLHIAANRFGMGYDRIMRLSEIWLEVQKEYAGAMNPVRNVEADVDQEHMDRELTRIIRGKQALIPFDERYPMLKKVRY